MSDEPFLARWSRRKQEAEAGHAEPAPEEAAEAPAPAPSETAVEEPAPPEMELSSLPPVESIDAETDITAFLRNGIPQELTRAALRRAWIADPAIRDFVGLAENAWDFNDPNAMAGFGALDYSAEQIDALVHRIVGGVAETAKSLAKPLVEAMEGSARSAPAEPGFAQSSDAVVIRDRQPISESAATELSPSPAASQPLAASEEMPLPRRTHGGALPR